METFRIRDKNTGMEVSVRGNQPPPVEALPQIFAKTRRSAAQMLETGNYKVDENFQSLSKEQFRDKTRRLTAQAIGVSPDEVDVDTGMGLGGRFQLDQLRDDASKFEFLQKKYGDENVDMINIGGKPKMFYRDPKTKKMTMVDEMGASLADFTADISNEAITTVGAVGGAIAGSALGPGGTITGATAGAALGGFATGVTQDVVSEVATGQEVDLGDITKQRGVEMGIGIPIDLATLGVGRIFARGVAGKAGRKALLDDFDSAVTKVEASDFFRKAETDLNIPEAMRSPRLSRKASELAAARPTSKIAKEMRGVRQTISDLRAEVIGESSPGAKTDSFNNTISKIATKYRSIVDEIAQTDKRIATQIEEGLSRKVRTLVAPDTSARDAGEALRRIFGEGETAAGRANDQNWTALDRAAKESGATISGKQVAATIREEAGRLAPLENKPLLQLAKKIEKEGDLSFTDLRGYLQVIEDSVPQNMEAGFKTAQQVAIAASKGVKKLREGVAREAGIGELYEDTVRYYVNDYLNFKRGAVGRTLKEQLGDKATTATSAANGVISDPENIAQALRAARVVGADRELRQELQKVYLNKIGLREGVEAMDVKNFNFDDDIVRELWGSRQSRELRNLQNKIKQADEVDVVSMRQEDVYDYLSSFSGQDKARIRQQIIQRSKDHKKRVKLENSALLKKMVPKKDKATGEWLEPEFTGYDIAKFSDNFVNASPTQVKRAMKLLQEQGDDAGIQAFRQSYIGKLLDRFSAGAQMDKFGNPMWNPEKLELSLRKGSAMRENLDTILGKEGTEEILALNKILKNAAEVRGSQVQELFQPRYSLTSGGLQLYGVGNLIGGLRGRALAWGFGSKRATQMMRFLADTATPEATAKQLEKLLPALMTTSNGITAIGIQGQFDPEFVEQIEPLFRVQDDQ